VDQLMIMKFFGKSKKTQMGTPVDPCAANGPRPTTGRPENGPKLVTGQLISLANIKKVFVMGGYIPNGGTYMAYHLGHILNRRFGYECLVVRYNDEEPQNVFEYPAFYPMVGLDAMEKSIGKNDILVVNPSFSHHCFGLRLECTKLMYIQDFKTFSVIDGFCNYYVCVSTHVQNFIHTTYGFRPPVIPAFIHTERIPSAIPWQQRPENVVFVAGKHYFSELLERFKKRMRERHPEAVYELVVSDRQRHADFLANLGKYRYFMALAPCEGFGLMPLEAMAAGCTVLGFHACGGLEFMTPGTNCQVAGYPDMDKVVDLAADLLKSPQEAAELAARGHQTAQAYSYADFEKRWTAFLDESLNR
jgi:hypothetical protein